MALERLAIGCALVVVGACGTETAVADAGAEVTTDANSEAAPEVRGDGAGESVGDSTASDATAADGSSCSLWDVSDCPVGCGTLLAAKVDAVKCCVTPEIKVCVPSEILSKTVTCAVAGDGNVFVLNAVWTTAPFRACTSEEKATSDRCAKASC